MDNSTAGPVSLSSTATSASDTPNIPHEPIVTPCGLPTCTDSSPSQVASSVTDKTNTPLPANLPAGMVIVKLGTVVKSLPAVADPPPTDTGTAISPSGRAG